jgi:hypothetical protein
VFDKEIGFCEQEGLPWLEVAGPLFEAKSAQFASKATTRAIVRFLFLIGIFDQSEHNNIHKKWHSFCCATETDCRTNLTQIWGHVLDTSLLY